VRDLAYDELGSGDPPVVLIHGIACDRRYLRPQLRHLAARHRTIAVDLRGHGKSSAPVQEYTIGSYAEDVARVCRRLELRRPVLVGHSLGGLVALQAASALPDLATGAVLIDSPLLAPPGRDELVRALLEQLRSDRYAIAIQDYFASFFPPGSDPALRERVLDDVLRTPRHVVISTWENGVFGFDERDALATCAVPLLYVDAGTPNCRLDLACRLCSQLAVTTVSGCGHFAQLEAPDQVNDAIDRFLSAPPVT
jgi:pimeloyl-ACP methyl ester carboxylesterase